MEESGPIFMDKFRKCTLRRESVAWQKSEGTGAQRTATDRDPLSRSPECIGIRLHQGVISAGFRSRSCGIP